MSATSDGSAAQCGFSKYSAMLTHAVDVAMIGPLGRDNVEGGTGLDADVWQTFAPDSASS